MRALLSAVPGELIAVLWEPSWGSDRGCPLSVLAAPPPPTPLLIGWINLEGNLTRSRIPPKLTIGIVFYICPQGRQMLLLSTTSTFEYPYLDTMGENTKGTYFGGQGRCRNLAVKSALCCWSSFCRLLIVWWCHLMLWICVNISFTDRFLVNMGHWHRS